MTGSPRLRRQQHRPEEGLSATTTAASTTPCTTNNEYEFQQYTRKTNRRRHRVTTSDWRLPLRILGASALALLILSLVFMSQSDSLVRSSLLRPAATAVWDHDVLHVVVTRFMQDQPHLLWLARARLQLLVTICLPTMIHQSTTEFIWIIQTDPKLDKEIRNELTQLLKPYPHFFLIGSNRQQQQGGTDGGSFRTVAKELLSSPIYTGDVKLLRQACQSHNSVPLLQTRLDADDGLHLQYLQRIQQEASKLFHQDHVQWYYWCIKRHFEWYSESNRLLPVEHSRLCITPGLTVGLAATESQDDNKETLATEPAPLTTAHDVLFKKIEKQMAAAAEANESHRQPGVTHTVPLVSPCGGPVCIRMVDDISIGAIRSRTWTSAGMMDIFSSDTHTNQDDMWRVLATQFGNDILTLASFQRAQAFLKEHMIDIARDNLEGQCTQGHSCKIKSVEALQRMIDIQREGQKLVDAGQIKG